MQNEKMQALKNNPQQQKMLNEVFKATDEAIKKEFNVFAKLVQADVSNFILQAYAKDGQMSDALVTLSGSINEMMTQVGKDMEKQMMAQFKAVKESAK